MSIQTVDAAMFRKMFLAGAARLQERKEYINELNVFPVPDGDTGTNMTMTIMAAAKEVEAVAEDDFKLLCKAISSGSLRGARGNSGVILSQLFRGFTKEIRDQKEINTEVLTKAFQRAVESAYKAVMKPKEGTMLTVARAGAEKSAEMFLETEDLAVYLEETLRFMRETLNKTPEMLPVLKEAGVVDSGGEGLMTVLEGAVDFLTGKTTLSTVDSAIQKGTQSAGIKKTVLQASSEKEIKEAAEITFGYCTEFIIMLEKPYGKAEEKEFKSYLESIGDCVVAVSDDDIVKVHVHTNDPGLAIQKGLSLGSLTSMKIDNMREEHHEKLIHDAEKLSKSQKQEQQEQIQEQKQSKLPLKPVGFLSVSAGDGLSEIFKGLGVDYVIEGGQTMNPSTEDILNAIARVNAENVFLLPNNKNIIMAANQAKDLVEDKKVFVIPSKTIPQGIAAMIQYVEAASPEENEKTMTHAMQMVKSGQVTYAVRDTSIDGKEIHQGDLMGLDDDGIEAVMPNVKECLFELLEQMIDDDSEFVSLYYGSNVKKEEAEQLLEELTERYLSVEIECNYGGQPIYYYIISVE